MAASAETAKSQSGSNGLWATVCISSAAITTAAETSATREPALREQQRRLVAATEQKRHDRKHPATNATCAPIMIVIAAQSDDRATRAEEVEARPLIRGAVDRRDGDEQERRQRERSEPRAARHGG